MVLIETLKKRVEKFPNSPGVYFWRDKKGKPIYIGRAGSLKKRVSSYFLKNRESRIAEMVSSASSIDFQKTDTLLEAVVLEANLIKKYWPKYNVEEKDDKSFIYLVITNEAFPKPIIIRGRELERYAPTRGPASTRGASSTRGGEVFGPYQSYRVLRMVLELLRPIFPYSTCRAASETLSPSKGPANRPCFHYQIGLCPGVCINKADKKEYRKNIRNLILFLRGDKKRLLNALKKENPDKAEALQHVRDVALLAESDLSLRGFVGIIQRRIEGYDISHLAGKEPVGAMVVFINGEKDPSQYRLFKIYGSEDGSPPSLKLRKGGMPQPQNYNDLAMLREVLERRLRHTEWPFPDIVFVDGGLLQVRTVRDVLAKKKIFVPVIGLSKGGKHAGSSYATDKLVALNVKPIGKEVLKTSKKLFQKVRNEAHRVAIRFNRKQRSLR